MGAEGTPFGGATSCAACPLRRFDVFTGMTEDEARFMQQFKTGEVTFAAGSTITREEEPCPQMFTLLRGMGLRYKMRPDGRRQVLSFLFPGDFIGIETTMMGTIPYSTVASTDTTLCVFQDRDLMVLFRQQPRRGFDLAWILARETSFLAEALTAVGQGDARQRLAWGILRLYQRASAVGLAGNGRFDLPYRQRDLAEALGLSLVHTNKTLSKLRDDGLASWTDGTLWLRDLPGLAAEAGIDPVTHDMRPLV